jgi:hypothetical protein
VLTDSVRAFVSPKPSAAVIPDRWAAICWASLTNAGRRERRAQASQCSSSGSASATGGVPSDQTDLLVHAVHCCPSLIGGTAGRVGGHNSDEALVANRFL